MPVDPSLSLHDWLVRPTTNLWAWNCMKLHATSVITVSAFTSKVRVQNRLHYCTLHLPLFLSFVPSFLFHYFLCFPILTSILLFQFPPLCFSVFLPFLLYLFLLILSSLPFWFIPISFFWLSFSLALFFYRPLNSPVNSHSLGPIQRVCAT